MEIREGAGLILQLIQQLLSFRTPPQSPSSLRQQHLKLRVRRIAIQSNLHLLFHLSIGALLLQIIDSRQENLRLTGLPTHNPADYS